MQSINKILDFCYIDIERDNAISFTFTKYIAAHLGGLLKKTVYFSRMISAE